jgi:rhamnosyl/mannosyltransferase
LVNKYYYPIVGGVETVVKQYAFMLRDLGYEVTVLSAKKKFSLETSISREDGVRVVRCGSLGSYFSMPVSLSFFIFLLLNYLSFDYIHFHEPFPLGSLACLLRYRRRQNIFVTWHSDIIKQKILKNTVGIFQKRLLGKATRITTTSPQLLEHSLILQQFRRKVDIIPLSIDVDSYRGEWKTPEKLSLGGYALYLGRLSYYKGIKVLLEAYTDSRLSMPLVIAGEGEEAMIVKRFMGSHPELDIRFVNRYLSDSEKKAYLANCAYFILPSIFPSEAFAIIQLEAMVFGKPVINTDLPTGVPWVSVDGCTGKTIRAGDAGALAEAMLNLSFDKAELRRCGSNARKRVMEIFADDRVKESIRTLYSCAALEEEHE